MCNFLLETHMLCWSSQKYLLCAAVAFFYGLVCLVGTAVCDPLPENPRDIPWHLSAMTVSFDSGRDMYIAEGRVLITGGRTRLEADYVEFSNKTQDAFAQGDVLLVSGEDSISCNAMTINLKTETGVMDRGTIYIGKNNVYIHGEHIQKTGRFSYSAEKGSITTCAGDDPDWKISGRDVRVTVEGYGTAKDAVFFAKNVPAAYTPFLIFPAKTKRQTGLLVPRISSSDRKGFEYEQPFFIAFSDQADATLYTDYMSDRGLKTAMEFRYVTDPDSRGAVYLDYLSDRRIDDGTPGNEYAFASTPRRTNEDRYWFRMKHDQVFSNGFKARMDLDLVSDADYLHEFKQGFTGFEKTNDYFKETFGRGLDEYDDTIRENRLNISRTWWAHTFNIDALWYDDINARRLNTTDTTLQTLPALLFDAAIQPLGNSGLYYAMNSEFRSFYRPDTTDELMNGRRIDAYPRLYLPFKLGKHLNLGAFAGARETIWYADETDINTRDTSETFYERHLMDFGAEMSTQFTRIFSPKTLQDTRIKHDVIPRLSYRFISDPFQEDLPYFDDLDRIDEQNRLTWSITNNIISRRTITDPEGEPFQTYRDMAYIRIYQDFYIDREHDTRPENFSDIFLTGEMYPNDALLLNLDLSYSPYDHDYRMFNIGGRLSDHRGDALTAEYRYTRDLSESLFSKIDIILTDTWQAYYSIEKNLAADTTIETRAGLALTRSCWALNLYMTESEDDTSFSFMINLQGIGGVAP